MHRGQNRNKPGICFSEGKGEPNMDLLGFLTLGLDGDEAKEKNVG